MVKRTVSLTLFISCCLVTVVFAAEPNDYLIPGKSHICQGSLSSLREAYQIFDAGLKDISCADCSTNRELIFLHAATRTAMLFIDNNDLAVNNSFLEVAEKFGVQVLGDLFDEIDVNVPLDSNGRYKIPAGAPDSNQVFNIVHDWIAEINDVNGIVAELDSISDSPSDRFRFFFEPNDTGLEANLEVDYGDLLVLKGLLLGYKSVLESKLAYDVSLDVNETLLHELLYEDGINPEEPDIAALAAVVGISDPNNISINDDFLNHYPDLLKVLPTDNFPDANGAAVLAKAKADLIAAVNYYFDAINYISSENDAGNDPQDDELLYIDPNNQFVWNVAEDRLTALRDSLVNDANMLCPLEITKTYDVYDSNSKLIGWMTLVYDWTGLQSQSEGNSYLTFTNGTPPPSPMSNPTWGIEWFDIYDNSQFEADLVCHYLLEHWDWDGYLEGTLNTNGDITDVNLYYWGHDDGSLEKFSCQLVSTMVTNITVNLNPIFGNTPCYPGPVDPRDLLPLFNQNNIPVACTFGRGLGNDATLGGILPDMTQRDWATSFELDSLVGDIDVDCGVDFADYAVLAAHWLNQNCEETDWCDWADIDQSNNVDIFDLAVFADNWLQPSGD